MSSTRHAEDCCCPSKTCGYCASSSIEESDAGENKLYCLDKLRPLATEPTTNENYGGSCPDTEVLQLCFDEYHLWYNHTCRPEEDGGNSCDDCDNCDCKLHEPVVQGKYKIADIPMTRSVDNPCIWKYSEDPDDAIAVNGRFDMGGTFKPCVATSCCPDGEGGYDGGLSRNSNTVTMGYEIHDIEVRLTPWCIDSEEEVRQFGYEMGTCGRLLQLQVRFRMNETEPCDDPACVGDGCMAGLDLFNHAICNRSHAGGAMSAQNFRGAMNWRGVFLPSCGCLPYCWQDVECRQCGDYDDNEFRNESEYNCFEKANTPLTPDAKGRDRLCNQRDCGCWGCCNDFDPDCIGCGGRYFAGEVGEVAACENLPFTGYVDKCLRGKTYSHGYDSGIWSVLLVLSNSKHGGGAPCPCTDNNSTNYGGCCWLDGNDADCQSENPFWGGQWHAGIYPPKFGLDNQSGVGFGMHWRFVGS